MDIIEPVTQAQLRNYFELRWKVLREPWQQPRGSERDALDDSAIHLMLIDDTGNAVGVGRLHFNSIREAQIRFMAIALSSQRQGLGSTLLHALETRALQLGAGHIVLDARESALGFYCRHGYRATGTGHVLFNRISHLHMVKPLLTAQGR